MSRHPSVEHIVQFFDSAHLPEHLASVAAKFENLKDDLLNDIATDTPEVAAGFRKLLEARDCFVRAAVAAKKQIPELIDDVTGNAPAPASSNSGVDLNTMTSDQ